MRRIFISLILPSALESYGTIIKFDLHFTQDESSTMQVSCPISNIVDSVIINEK